MGAVVLDETVGKTAASAADKADAAVWSRALREAIAAGNERRYRRTLMRFLCTRPGVACVGTMLGSASVPVIMRRSFDRLAPAMGLTRLADLAQWMREDVVAPAKAVDGAANDVTSLAAHYLRFLGDWAAALRRNASHAVAVALMFLEPVLWLHERQQRPQDAESSVGRKAARQGAERTHARTGGCQAHRLSASTFGQ
jgi:hypothetical protein